MRTLPAFASFAPLLRTATSRYRYRACSSASTNRYECGSARIATIACEGTKPASRKSAGEAAAITSAVKAGVAKEAAERAIAIVQRASNLRGDDATLISEFMPWDSADVLAAAAERTIPYTRTVLTGGIEDSERAVLACCSARNSDLDIVSAACAEHLSAVVIRGELTRGDISQRDLLGAILATIQRKFVGDVLLGEDGNGYVVLHSDMASYLVSNLVSVGKVGVSCQLIELSAVSPKVRRVKEFYSVEKSTRLDAIASAGFGTSRTAMADRIRRGNVRVNQTDVKNVSKNMHAGDKISVRGMGRIEIGDIIETRKGNKRVEIKRYL